jgi:hypothetical protein
MKFSPSLLAIVAALAPVACHSKKENASESLPPVAVRTVIHFRMAPLKFGREPFDCLTHDTDAIRDGALSYFIAQECILLFRSPNRASPMG